MQKKKSNAANDEFEEFEEDIMEEEDTSSTTTASASNPTSSSSKKSNKATLEERHELVMNKLASTLNKTSYQLESAIPSFKPIGRLFEASLTPELVTKSLEILKQWRLKGFKVPEDKMKDILIRLYSLNVPSVALDLLKHRELYGIDLNSVRDADGLFMNLSTKSVVPEGATEVEIKQAIDTCFDALSLTQFTARQTSEPYPDLVGHIMTAKLCLGQGNLARGIELLEALQEIGEEDLMVQFSKLSSKMKSRVVLALRIVVGELSKGGKNGKEGELLKLFGTLEKRVVDSKAGKGLKGLGMI